MFGHGVFQNLLCTNTQGRCGAKPEGIIPVAKQAIILVGQREYIVIYNEAGDTLGSLGQVAYLLTMGRSDHFADVAFDTRWLAVDAIAHPAIYQQTKQFTLDI